MRVQLFFRFAPTEHFVSKRTAGLSHCVCLACDCFASRAAITGSGVDCNPAAAARSNTSTVRCSPDEVVYLKTPERASSVSVVLRAFLRSRNPLRFPVEECKQLVPQRPPTHDGPAEISAEIVAPELVLRQAAGSIPERVRVEFVGAVLLEHAASVLVRAAACTNFRFTPPLTASSAASPAVSTVICSTAPSRTGIGR